MSYEGYEQHICKNGHYFNNYDIYSVMFSDDPVKCSYCQAPSAWRNCVDQTNGPSQGVIPMEKFNAFLVSPAEHQECNLGHFHLTKEAVYRVPTQKETEPLCEYFEE